MARRRGLSAEDKTLWSRVASTAVPLHPARKQAQPAPEPPPLKKPPAVSQPAPLPLADLRLGARSGGGSTRVDLSPPLPQALHAQPLRMDHKTHRQMSRGKLAPEARIDLHGMTLAVAQPVLTRFVMQARADGRRLVLVITGKGRGAGPDAPLPVRPGALRHTVPHWLHMPPLNAAVLQVRPAHRRHGGEGAYYVYLRR
ncbi:DNA-nicking endonuclease, Smr domain [Paracoccus thiocyanatus]|uniref:DNA-nicking endonuclease, Smr domain n=2 Tax=Paracoccus thiocyanatus TaxID=34006 RepID=A0A1N6QBL5_9RHOB|nr:Smr/MutS family protein [Paracoccus thiocyanatus]SIQ13942.1 DNA-nicking endonuclease, Smr domain [Paracoccus thiocyanatus]